MQSAGDAGVVVVSFGSMVANITMERANVMATAFGQLPQKVTRDPLVLDMFLCNNNNHRINLFILTTGPLEIQWATSKETVC